LQEVDVNPDTGETAAEVSERKAQRAAAKKRGGKKRKDPLVSAGFWHGNPCLQSHRVREKTAPP
jgi:hypothetical protein